MLRGAGLDERDVARVAELPVWSRMNDQRGLAESMELGLGPLRSRRTPLARIARELLAPAVGAGAA